MKSFFITGTDTNIGKTHVMCELIRAALSQQQRVLALKPVASGCIQQAGQWVSEDVLQYDAVLGGASLRTPWAFEPPIAPHLAASAVGVELCAEDIATWCLEAIQKQPVDTVLIEGAGGLLVPLNAHQTWVDVIHLLNIPVILVVGLRLGCINHALLTEAVLLANQCQVEGWIANDFGESGAADMETTLKHWMKSACLRTEFIS
ncbi:MAG: dethiobiotin synthase [Gammaproteobacteria bacterium]|nr:dethiobiotin synthase [Gammaproteobacteria bacterium]